MALQRTASYVFCVLILICWSAIAQVAEEGFDQYGPNLNPYDDDVYRTEEILPVVKKDGNCAGCTITLNKDVSNLDQLIESALRDIVSERDYAVALLDILNVDRQIVAGVKYGLNLKIAPTVCSKNVVEVNPTTCPLNENSDIEYCRIDFLQKPWLSDEKFIISNNCTNGQTYSYPVIQRTTTTAVPIAYDDIMTMERLLDLESQIIPEDQFRRKPPTTEETYFNDLDAFFDEFNDIDVMRRQDKRQTEGSSTDVAQNEPNPVDVAPSLPDQSKPLDDPKPSDEVKPDETKQKPDETKQKPDETKQKPDETKQKPDETKQKPETKDSSSSEESSEETKTRTKRGTKDSRAQSSLEKEDHVDNESKEVKHDEDSITRHKRDDSSSSSSSSEEKKRNEFREPLVLARSKQEDKRRKNEDSSDDTSSSSEDDDKNKVRRSADADSIDEEILLYNLGKYVTSLFDGLDVDNFRQIPLSVVNLERNILEGYIYNIKLKIGVSTCKEDKEHIMRTNVLQTYQSDDEECKKNLIKNHIKYCKVQVHVSEAYTNPKLLNSQCHGDTSPKARTKRGVPGGITEVSTDDATVLELMEHTLNKLDGESTHQYKYKIENVLSASKQIVAGVLYRIKANVAVSDCLKSEAKDRNDCGTLKEEPLRTCYIEIWDRPWLANGRQTNTTCDNVNKVFRSKRYADELEKPAKHFIKFMSQFNVTYKNKQELKRRYAIFKENLNTIKLLNDFELGTGKYGVTRFADLTKDEFRKNYLGLRTDLRKDNEIPFVQAEIPDVELPDEFDWRTKNAVTEVKDQGSCGSCWAFSTTGNVEGQYALRHGELLEFSEQELVDCDKFDEGCGGGLMDNAYRAIEDLGGLELETDYPYDAHNEKCHFNKTMARVRLSGAVNISQNEDDMAKWLTQNGPISIAINANAMQFYVGGVSHPWKFLCNPKSLDHGVLIVGYGVHTYPVYKKSLPYWLVKNSWGKKWGEQGYYRVYRGDGTCGVNQTPSSAIVE